MGVKRFFQTFFGRGNQPLSPLDKDSLAGSGPSVKQKDQLFSHAKIVLGPQHESWRKEGRGPTGDKPVPKPCFAENAT